METLTGLACVLGCIGLLIYLIRSASRSNVAREEMTEKPCPGCEAPIFGWQVRCPRCGLRMDSNESKDLRELRTAIAQVRLLIRRKELGLGAGRLVIERLQRRCDFLQGRRVAPIPAEEVEPAVEARPTPAPPPELPPVVAVVEQQLTPTALEQLLPEPAAAPLEVVVEEAKPALAPAEVPAIPPPLPLQPIVEEKAAPAAAPVLTPIVQPVPAPARQEMVERPRRIEPAPAPPPPPEPARSWGDVLAAFMEEKNILWGELVGGLLIVGCSIALVITLWGTLEQIPYFPFLVFSGISLALFGAGQYTLHHWKLESTSRGLLVIATLLIPLNLLVLAGLPRDETSAALEMAVSLVGLLIFAGMVNSAGWVLTPGLRGLLLLGYAASAWQLLPPHLLTGPNPAMLLALGLGPVACFALAGTLALQSFPGDEDVKPEDVRAFLAFLGLTGFALAVSFGFVISRAVVLGLPFVNLSLPLAVAGIPVVMAGMWLQRRLGEETTPATETAETARRTTAATALALIGLLVLLGAVAIAWPVPGYVGAVCGLNFLTLTILALRYQTPLAHLAALPCLAAAYLAGACLIAEPASLDVLEFVAHPATGALLVPLVAGLLVSACWLSRQQREDHADYHAGGALAALAASLLLVWSGGQDGAWRASWVTASHSLFCLYLAVLWRRWEAAATGHGLLVFAAVWALGALDQQRSGLSGLLLALLALGFGLLALWRGHQQTLEGEGTAEPEEADQPWPRLLAWPARWSALACVVLSLSFSVESFEEPILVLTSALLAATTFLATWVFGRAAGTWTGVLILLFGLGSACRHLNLPHPWLAGTLGIASAALASSLWLARRLAISESLPRAEAARSRRHRLDYLFRLQLGRAGLAGSLLTLPMTLPTLEGNLLAPAAYVFWAALLWLVFAWIERSPGWFAAFQGGVSLTVLLLVTSWLTARMPIHESLFPLSRESFHAYLAALAALGTVWAVARYLLPGERWNRLLREYAVSWDRVTLVLLLALFVITLCWDAGVAATRELTAGTPLDTVAAGAFGPFAWLAWGLLTLATTAYLWDRSGSAAILGLTSLGLAVPALIAGAGDASLAGATALRWSLGAALLALSAPVWLRHRLGALAGRLGLGVRDDLHVVELVRWLTIAGTVGPILLLTGTVAALGFSGLTPAGPAAGSFFARLGWVPANVVPLGLVCVGLVGHAIRERSASFAFAGGPVFNLSLVGGYALAVVSSGGILDDRQMVILLQLGTLGAAAWGLGWLATRPWLLAWREIEGSTVLPVPRLLQHVQSGMALAGNGLLILVGTFPLVFFPPGASPVLTQTVGGPLGWAALLVTGGAIFLRQVQNRQPLWEQAPAALAIGLVCLLGCTAEAFAPTRGYLALTLLFSIAALAWSLVPPGEQDGIFRRQPRWLASQVAINAGLALPLVLGLAFVHEQPLWASLTVALGVLAGVRVAVRLGNEAWLLVSGLGFNLALTLAAWRWQKALDEANLSIFLGQVNVLASGLVALAWLPFRQRFSPPTQQGQSLLGVQAYLGLVPGLAGFILASGGLIVDPVGASLPGMFTAWSSWLAWGVVILAAAAHARAMVRRSLPDVLLFGALGAGVLAAWMLHAHSPWPWASYHLLALIWAVVGIGVGINCLRDAELELRSDIWLHVSCLVLAVLGLRALVADPSGPWCSFLALISAGALLAILALQRQSPQHAYGSGLAWVLAGMSLWAKWGDGPSLGFLLTLATSLALASCLWSLLDRLAGRWQANVRAGFLPVAHLSVQGGLVILTTAVVLLTSVSLGLFEAAAPPWLPWLAIAAVALALVLCLKDRSATFVAGACYLLGLLVAAQGLNALKLGPQRYLWASGLALAGFVLVALLVASQRPVTAWPEWFGPAERTLACLVVGVSLWVTWTFPATLDRLAGPASLALLLPTGMVLARKEDSR